MISIDASAGTNDAYTGFPVIPSLVDNFEPGLPTGFGKVRHDLFGAYQSRIGIKAGWQIETVAVLEGRFAIGGRVLGQVAQIDQERHVLVRVNTQIHHDFVDAPL